MSGYDVKNDNASNNLNTTWFVVALFFIVLLVVGFYFFNFNYHILKNWNWSDVFNNLSPTTGNWGTFGDYIGGILNPIIAAFAFYLIARTYNLQKIELEATRKLLAVSTDAQKDQIKLAALTALHNSNSTRISLFESEKISLLQGTLPAPMELLTAEEPLTHDDHIKKGTRQMIDSRRPANEVRDEKIKARLNIIEDEIKKLTETNNNLEEKIKSFLK